MTNNTMREAFEKWAEDNALNVSWRSGDEYLVADTAAAWRAWQVAQSVPVVGEPVGFILIHENGGRNLTFHDNTDDLADGWSQHKLIIQPTTSITAQELDALRKDAETSRKERDNIKRLLAYARDDVFEHLQYMRTSFRDSPRNQKMIERQEQLIKEIDAAMQERQP